MPINFGFGIGKTTQLYYNKLLVAKANEVISGGDKYYSTLAEKLNTGKVADYVKDHSDSFELKVGNFLTKKQEILEQNLFIRPANADPIKRYQVVKELVEEEPDNKGLRVLANIYKYFAEKARPEMYL